MDNPFSAPVQNQNTQKLDIHVSLFVPLIIGTSFVLSALVGALAFYGVHSLDNVLVVTGSAKVHVTADTVKWRLNIVQKVSEAGITAGYPMLANDLGTVKTFLKANNISEDAVTVSQVFVEEIYNYNQNAGGPRQFNLRQEIVVQSKDVVAVDALSKNVGELAGKGVFLSSNYLEFFVSNLPELRISLLADAVKDAKARATEIAKAGGKRVGSLKSASSGVVQVLAPNSIEISDYGTYDTQSLEKEVMVTARATFFVR